MKSAVLVLGCLYLTTAAPVDELERRTRDASDEELQVLLRQVKETLANVNNKPEAVAQTSVQPKPAINSPQAPHAPPVRPTTHQGASTPQIYFFIAHPQLPQPLVPGQEVAFSPPAGPALPQQGGAVAPSQFPQASIPGLHQTGVAIPVSIPSQEQSFPLTQFYLQPLSPLQGPVQYLYVSPYNSYSPPAVAFTPPYMLRDTAASPPPGQ